VLFFYLAIFAPLIAPWEDKILSEGISGFEVGKVQQKITFCGKDYNSPAYGMLDENSTIVSVNGQALQVGKALNIKPKEPIELVVVEKGVQSTKTITPTELGQYGFSIKAVMKEGYALPPLYSFYREASALLGSFIFWLILLNFMIAVVNFLPIEPFDGGKIAKILLYPYFGFLNMSKEDTQKFIGRLLLWVVAIAMLVNALPLFL